MVLRIFALLALYACAQWAAAAIYKTVDENGNVIYTDTPKDKSAEAIELQPVNTQPAVKPRTPPKPTANDSGDKEKATSYRVRITSPANDSTIPTGQESVAVQVSLSPKLAAKHRLQLLVNGAPLGKGGRSTRFQLSALQRGTLNLQARVVDADNKVLASSDSINMHIKRHSILNRAK